MLQIDAAASDPIARTTALLSLISALMSLLFGSIYIIRFGTMRKMYKAASWADVRRVSHLGLRLLNRKLLFHRKRRTREHPSCGMYGSCSPYQLFGLPGELSCYIAGGCRHADIFQGPSFFSLLASWPSPGVRGRQRILWTAPSRKPPHMDFGSVLAQCSPWLWSICS